MNEIYTLSSTNPVPNIAGPRRGIIDSIVSDVFAKEQVRPTLTEVSDQPGALKIDLAEVSDAGRRAFRKRIEKVMRTLDIAVSTESSDGPLTPVASYKDDDAHEFTAVENTEVAI